MRRGRILSFLVSFVLLLFLSVSCGIPRMFPWRSTYQYNISSSSLDFKLHFTTESNSSGAATPTQWNLQPSPNTPILRLYYIIVPDTDASFQNSVVGMASSFYSQYRSSFPKSFGEGDAAYSRSFTTTLTDDENITVALWEMSVIHDDGTFEPASSFFQGLDFFEPVGEGEPGTDDGENIPGEDVGEGTDEGDEPPSEDEPTTGLADQYVANYDFSQERSGNGYYILMNLNGTTYRLGRMNGQPFSLNLADYYEDSSNDTEFLYEDRQGLQTNAILNIYLTASFAFENYTTRSTIELQNVHSNSLLVV